MGEEEVVDLLTKVLPDADISVQANGNSFMLRIVSDKFEGLNSLKRQQMVYGYINEKIKSGEMHAVTMRLFTMAE